MCVCVCLRSKLGESEKCFVVPGGLINDVVLVIDIIAFMVSLMVIYTMYIRRENNSRGIQLRDQSQAFTTYVYMFKQYIVVDEIA